MQQRDAARGTGSKFWSGRFAADADARLDAFNASVEVDRRLIREDIRGSVAHVRMLGRQGIIPAGDAATIEDGLWRVWREVDDDRFALTLADEDVHTGVERRLRELIGPVAGKLHTARSRNDQVATDFRLWTRGAIVALTAASLDLVDALLDVAEANYDVVMPGYTHLQRAQPVLLSHHLHAYVEMLLRDLDRLHSADRRVDRSPLGAGALAGVTFPVDREGVAAELGFSAPVANSLDAVSDRDFVLDLLFACATIAIHLTRLSEEIILWASAEFQFIELSDAFSTGSSIMPQKKNPDVAELARGKSGRVVGQLVAMLMIVKGTPLAYNKDFQEDKAALFDAVDTVLAVLDIYPPMLRTARFRRERLADAAAADFSLATDAADLLARRGVPFREAHAVVGQLVAECLAAGKTFADLSAAEWAAVHPVFASEQPPLSAAESVAARDVPGGTAPNRVASALSVARGEAASRRTWLDQRSRQHEAVMRPPLDGPPR